MSKLSSTASTINAVNGIVAMAEQVKSVKNSKLSDDEKQKALNAHKKMIGTTILVVVLACLLMMLGVFYGLSLESETGIMIVLISAILCTVTIILYAIFGRKLFPDWTKYYSLVHKGFDGLSEEEIAKLEPNDKDNRLIKKYKKKALIIGLIFLAILILEISVIFALEMSIYSPIPLAIIIITTIVWFVKNDTCEVEIHRLQSGYYKKGFGYLCEKCGNEFTVEFEKIDIYDKLQKDENGIRFVYCPNCKNVVKLYNFDLQAQDYKKYLEE